jgi:murein L,D-transpeptidase YcbB/YkuD
VLASCREKVVNPNDDLTLETYNSLDTTAYRLNSKKIRHEMERLALSDSDSTWADARVRTYYLRHGKMLWVNRLGADWRADSVLARLKTVESIGFSQEKFCVPQIESDLQRMRDLRFDDSTNTSNRVYARLEYYLTKGYLRYVAGQRFGFVNPSKLFNRLDVHTQDSLRVTYRRLFDLPIQHPGPKFFAMALNQVSNDSVVAFMDRVQPESPFYHNLLQRLRDGKVEPWGRANILVNMERCRWRMPDYPQSHSKYILVNIPSFKLQAVDGKDTLTMRIGCGTFETKTPLLVSQVKRMDLNPQWILPKSIVKKSVLNHLGNRAYFESRRFFIRERKTGKTVDIGNVTAPMLLGGDYLVIQEGGEGSALGRIIFRFDNKFSVYLHSTSQPGVFSREDRGVSHGCIRVEKPFDLAVFMLEKKDPKVIRKIGYSMQADVSPLGKRREDMSEEQQQVADTLQRNLLVGNIVVKPRVPLYILYFTLYPDANGNLRQYSDVYGYDRVTYDYLRNFI